MKLLIVDDIRLNHIVASKLIEKSGLDLQTSSAYSAVEAFKLYEKDSYDIILLDIMMPEIDGLEVLIKIRNEYEDSKVKILMYTAIDKKEMLEECFENGATDYITKPVDIVEFMSRLKSAMKQKTIEDEKNKFIEQIKSQNDIIAATHIQMVQQEKMAAVGQLAAGIAHEINNPLGFVVSNFSVLKEYICDLKKGYSIFYESMKYKNVDDEKFNELNNELIEYTNALDYDYISEDLESLFEDTDIGLDRVITIVKSLRSFSRVDNFDEFNFFDINEGIRTTLVIANNGIKFIADVECEYGDIADVKVVGSEINQVILNIIMNATHAIEGSDTNDFGKILIRTYEDEVYVNVSISDNGKGMTEEISKSIFNPFFTTKAVGKGTGLGLSISYDIVVNKHKGKIEVFSEVDKGTEFVVSLPINME